MLDQKLRHHETGKKQRADKYDFSRFHLPDTLPPARTAAHALGGSLTGPLVPALPDRTTACI